MILVKRPEIPAILQENQQAWTNELYFLIHQFGSYSKIPDQIKNPILNNYKSDQIKNSVRAMLHGKCVYCEALIESLDYPHIEHFYPKSIYPKYTFKWSNLFPSCTKCNISKGELDTKLISIVNPEKENPESYFVFKELRIDTSPTSPNPVKSDNTIKHCNLQRIGLSQVYASMLIALYTVEEGLKESIRHYMALKQNAAKLKEANRILEAIDNLKKQGEANVQHAGYTRFYLKNSQTITECVSIINIHATEFGINNYTLDWT